MTSTAAKNPEWKYDELVTGLNKEKGKKFSAKEIEKVIIEMQKESYLSKDIG